MTDSILQLEQKTKALELRLTEPHYDSSAEIYETPYGITGFCDILNASEEIGELREAYEADAETEISIDMILRLEFALNKAGEERIYLKGLLSELKDVFTVVRAEHNAMQRITD